MAIADKRFKAAVPDVPEAVAEGATEAEAMQNIKTVLELALGDRLRDRQPIPVPSHICGAPKVRTDKFILQAPQVCPISGGRQ
jgi:predicted RNase H-like HicB family nuclease